jgi:hypothetical protein
MQNPIIKVYALFARCSLLCNSAVLQIADTSVKEWSVFVSQLQFLAVLLRVAVWVASTTLEN